MHVRNLWRGERDQGHPYWLIAMVSPAPASSERCQLGAGLAAWWSGKCGILWRTSWFPSTVLAKWYPSRCPCRSCWRRSGRGGVAQSGWGVCAWGKTCRLFCICRLGCILGSGLRCNVVWGWTRPRSGRWGGEWSCCCRRPCRPQVLWNSTCPNWCICARSRWSWVPWSCCRHYGRPTHHLHLVWKMYILFSSSSSWSVPLNIPSLYLLSSRDALSFS